MALDVAAARAAVTEAALARDRGALLAVADSLPILTAFAYERHRARAYAHALCGARGSAQAELCLGVAASAPSSMTLAADSAHLHLLLGDPARAISTLRTAAAPAPTRDYRSAAAVLRQRTASAQRGVATAFEQVTDRALVRVVVSGAALGAALAALVALPDLAFDDGRRDSAGITGPARTARAGTVVAELPVRAAAPTRRLVRPAPAQVPEATLVRALLPISGARTGRDPRPDRDQAAPAAARRPPTPAAPPPPSPPSPAPEPVPPPPAASPSTPSASAPAVSPVAASPPDKTKGRGLAKAAAPGQVKKSTAPPLPPASEPPPADPAARKHDDEQGSGKEKQDKEKQDKEHGRGA